MNAVQRYRDVDRASRTEGATPHALVAMLYDELAVALAVMASANAAGDTRRRLDQHARASSVLHALECGLDRTRGGNLAQSLASIYRQMRQRLLVARSGDAGALDEVRQGVASLAEAWGRIV